MNLLVDLGITETNQAYAAGGAIQRVRTGAVDVGRTQQGLVVQGRFAADTDLECVRCLNGFSDHLAWEFAELCAFSEETMTDSGLLLPESAQIDLAPLLRDVCPARSAHQSAPRPGMQGAVYRMRPGPERERLRPRPGC